MGTARVTAALIATVLAGAVRPAHAQQDTATREPPDHPTWQLNLRVAGTGLSFGNSTRHNGLRLNLKDHALDRINGVNVTLWTPGENVGGRVNGLAVGLTPAAGRLNGIALGLGVLPEHRLAGIGAGILGVVGGGDLYGASIGGLGTVAGRDIAGAHVGGLAMIAGGAVRGLAVSAAATVSGREAHGITVSGLATVAGTSLRGLNVAGLAAVGGEDLRGLSIAGLALVSGADARGVQIAGAEIVAGGAIRWVTVAGLAVVGGNSVRGVVVTLGAVAAGEDVTGLALGGFRVKSPRTEGVTLAVGYTLSREHTGFAAAGYNETRGPFRGSPSASNNAHELHGVQIGVINIARNNRGLARVLRWSICTSTSHCRAAAVFREVSTGDQGVWELLWKLHHRIPILSSRDPPYTHP
jgi:hypothetical protein